MLELKGIDYRLAHVLPGNQRIHLRLTGFRGGTVPALKLDGRRIQGERWGDVEFQDVPRRKADAEHARRDVAELPGDLDRVDEEVAARSYPPLARELFPHFPDELVPPFVQRLGVA